jgi:hypothetical protein
MSISKAQFGRVAQRWAAAWSASTLAARLPRCCPRWHLRSSVRPRAGLPACEVMIQHVVHGVIEGLVKHIDERRIQLTIDMPSRPLQLRADPVRLARIVETWSLCTKARSVRMAKDQVLSPGWNSTCC